MRGGWGANRLPEGAAAGGACPEPCVSKSLNGIRYALNPFSERLAGNAIIIGKDQRSLSALGRTVTEERGLRRFIKRRKKYSLKCGRQVGDDRLVATPSLRRKR